MAKAKNKKVDKEGAKRGKGGVPSKEKNFGDSSKKEAVGADTRQD